MSARTCLWPRRSPATATRIRPEPVDELGSEVLRVGGAPAVATDEDLAAGPEADDKPLRDVDDYVRRRLDHAIDSGGMRGELVAKIHQEPRSEGA